MRARKLNLIVVRGDQWPTIKSLGFDSATFLVEVRSYMIRVVVLLGPPYTLIEILVIFACILLVLKTYVCAGR